MGRNQENKITRGQLVALALAALAVFGVGAGRQAFAAARPLVLGGCVGEQFSDNCPTDWYYNYVLDLSDIGAISGYSDNTFRPVNQVTRGQAAKIVVIANGLAAPLPVTNTFADAPAGSPFYQWVEVGAARGLLSGYRCGASNDETCDANQRPYFRPSAEVNRGQLAKMVVIARGWTALTPAQPTFSDVPADNVFFGFVERASAYGVISGYADHTFRPFSSVTRAQASKIVDLARLWGQPAPTPRPTHTPAPPTATATATTTAPPSATVTATTTTQPTATTTTGSGPTIAGCQVFPANNIWNRRVTDLPVYANSRNYINSIGANTLLHPDFGSGLYDNMPIGIPYVVVPGSQPGVNVTFLYDDESDRPPYPVPTDAPIEGGPNSDGDRHVIVIDKDNCVLHELYSAYPQPDGSWQAGSGARWSLLSNALRPDTWTSADAAGLPIFAGLVRYEEFQAGVIKHAIRVTAQDIQKLHIWPARHGDGASPNTNLPPMGLRLRLKASVDISGYGPQTRVVLQALKDYGMILADTGSAWNIGGVPDERWDNDQLVNQMRSIKGADFEAVDESGLMIDPNSGEARQ